ncbi:hypothetical protein PspR84_06945 [Pseudomonas sp. R84]|jgi:uncharacterized membrane protein|nr:hypothetical protein PspR84_06945 [Pseudomonas sp. R84]
MRKARFERIAPFFVFGVLGLGAYPLLRVLLVRVPPLRQSLFPDAEKVTKKACPGVRHFAEAQCSLATVGQKIKSQSQSQNKIKSQIKGPSP